jgi:serine/threonine-protein kinase
MWNVRMARRYVRACELVKHPAVVPFVDVGTSGGHHYLAWPLIEGETLAARVARDGPLAPEEAAYYAERVADALAACHEQGLVHGLVNPANVMIGADKQVYLLDSGIGALLAQSGDEQSLIHTLGQTSLLTGGVDCGSPESILDPAQRTPAGDQYSLGCTLFFLLTGRFPFEGPPVQKMTAHQFEVPPDLCVLVPEVPEELAAIVVRLLQKSPDHRFALTADVAEALRSFAVAPEPRQETPAPLPKLPTRVALVDEPAEPPAEPAPAVRGRDRVSAMLIGVILVVGVLAGLAAGWLLK